MKIKKNLIFPHKSRLIILVHLAQSSQLSMAPCAMARRLLEVIVASCCTPTSSIFHNISLNTPFVYGVLLLVPPTFLRGRT